MVVTRTNTRKQTRKQTRNATKNSTVRIVIKHAGVLGAFGYHDIRHLSVSKRRAALRKAANVLGWLYLIRKLNALYVFNKYRYKELAAKFKQDREYASARHAVTKPELEVATK